MTHPKRGLRGPYSKPPVRIPPPTYHHDPSDTRHLSQERAAEITGRSPAVVSRWAHGRAKIDAQSLALLQLHIWGAVLPIAWQRRGIHVDGESLITDTGLAITAGELQAFAWLRNHYGSALAELQARQAPVSAPAVPLAEVIPLEALRLARSARLRALGGGDGVA